MPVRPMLLHRFALVSFRLSCKNLGNLQDFLGGKWFTAPPPPWQKITRTPMLTTTFTYSHANTPLGPMRARVLS